MKLTNSNCSSPEAILQNTIHKITAFPVVNGFAVIKKTVNVNDEETVTKVMSETLTVSLLTQNTSSQYSSQLMLAMEP